MCEYVIPLTFSSMTAPSSHNVCVCVRAGFVADRMVEVLFVDVGNRKVLSVCELRKTKEDFFVLPVMVRCFVSVMCLTCFTGMCC